MSSELFSTVLRQGKTISIRRISNKSRTGYCRHRNVEIQERNAGSNQIQNAEISCQPRSKPPFCVQVDIPDLRSYFGLCFERKMPWNSPNKRSEKPSKPKDWHLHQNWWRSIQQKFEKHFWRQVPTDALKLSRVMYQSKMKWTQRASSSKPWMKGNAFACHKR